MTTFNPSSVHVLLTSTPELHNMSNSWGPTSRSCFLEAKERRSGKPSSMPWNPALAMALSFSSRLWLGVPTETVA